MDGQLENPSRYSTLEGKCICLKGEELRQLDDILRKAIQDFSDMHRRKGLTPLPEDEMLKYIKDNLLVLFVDDKYIVGLDVVRAWFSSDAILAEEFVYKYGEGTATMTDVAEGMMSVARYLECGKVQVGTLAADSLTRHRALASVYERSGFKIDAITLNRSVPWDL